MFSRVLGYYVCFIIRSRTYLYFVLMDRKKYLNDSIQTNRIFRLIRFVNLKFLLIVHRHLREYINKEITSASVTNIPENKSFQPTCPIDK